MPSQLAIFSNEVIQLCFLVGNWVQHCISQNYIFYGVPHKQPVILWFPTLYYLHTPLNKDCTYGKKKSSTSQDNSAAFSRLTLSMSLYSIKTVKRTPGLKIPPNALTERCLVVTDQLWISACREHISHFPSNSK